MAHVYKSDVILTFTVAMVTKIGNRLFRSKLETFDRAVNIENKQIPKRYFNR